MSTFDLSVTGDKDEHLEKALQLVFDMHLGTDTTACGWYIGKEGEMVLTWHNEKDGINKLPTDMRAEACYSFIRDWLKGLDGTYQELQKGFGYFDGTIKRGWKVYLGNTDMQELNFYTIARIKPELTLYGK